MMKQFVHFGWVLVLMVGSLPMMAADQVSVDPRLPEYRAVSGVSGSIKSVGSDTLNNLMTLWAEKFREVYPSVSVEIEGKGSSTAPPALIAGSSNFGPMSREMKQNEVDQFEKRFGYKPMPLQTSIDMLAVYVHKDNPISAKGLSLKQVDAIFSKTRKGGHNADLTRWGQVGLDGAWTAAPFSLYGRNSASGTYGYFKSKALFKGDYRDSVKEMPGSSAVVQGVATDKYGIGYSGIGYKTADVRTVPLAKGSAKPVPPTADRVADYPLARFLMVYINHKPGSSLDPLRREFVKLLFSQQGQEVVIKDGYLPVSYEVAKRNLSQLGINIDKDF